PSRTRNRTASQAAHGYHSKDVRDGPRISSGRGVSSERQTAAIEEPEHGRRPRRLRDHRTTGAGPLPQERPSATEPTRDPRDGTQTLGSIPDDLGNSVLLRDRVPGSPGARVLHQ